MSTATVTKINFEPHSDMIALLHRRDFPLVDHSLVEPLNINALTDGEWVTFASPQRKLVRATDIETLGDVAKCGAFVVWSEVGRTDVQAMSAHKVPIIYMGSYEANTRIFNAEAITNLLQPLKVATIKATVKRGSGAGYERRFSGLVGASNDDSDPIVGYVTMLPQNNGGRLMFMNGWAVRNGVA